jgi:hypothetical protein
MVWTVLFNRKLVTDPPGSTAYRQFEHDMADLSEQALLKGLDKSRNFVGFFTTPSFRELCRVTPTDYGLPDSRTAMLEACNATERHQWTHPAIYHAAQAVGSYDLKNRTERELWPIWDHAYETVCRRVMDGKDLALPVPKALPESVFVPADENKAVGALASLRAML